MSSRQEQFSGTKTVAEPHRFDQQRLEDYLQAHLDGFAGPLEVRQFKGGQSNPTYRLITPSHEYVLRRKPPGKLLPSAHAVDREFRVINALHGAGFPVPRAHLLCEDDSIVGTMFFVMDFQPGRIFWDADIPGLNVAERRAIYTSMNQTIARLHSIDYEAIGLASYGKPGNYFARQISRWTKQYRASETTAIAAMNRLIDWLPGNIPEDDSVSIVHGDYRLDNLIIAGQSPDIAAVLDWELGTLGHPLGDFTYHLMIWRMPAGEVDSVSTLSGRDLKAIGVPTEAEYTAMYCEHTGRDRIEHLDFYMAYNFFRLAAILQGIAGRIRDGTATNEHARTVAGNVQPLSEQAWRYAREAGAI